MSSVAGRVAPIFRGEYSASNTYQYYDVVTHNNKMWISKKSGTINVEPAESNSDYWFLAIDDTFTDASTLDGHDSDYFATAQSVTDILNGTTTVGNADKLDGLHAEDFVKVVSKVVDATVTLAELEGLLPSDGKGRFVYRTGTPSDFPTNLFTPPTTSLLSVEVKKVGGIAYYNINAVKLNGTPVKITGYYNGTFFWKLDNDGGNADTVDGYHATDLMSTIKYLDIYDKTGTYDLFSDTYNNRIVQIFATGANVSNLPETLLSDDGYGDGIVHGWMITFSIGNYSRKIFLSLRSRKTYETWESNSTWFTWHTNFYSTGGTLTGNITVNKETPIILLNDTTSGGTGRMIQTNHTVAIQNLNSSSDFNTRRQLSLYNSNHATYGTLAKAIQLFDIVSGKTTAYTVLHTGNYTDYAADVESGAFDLTLEDGTVVASGYHYEKVGNMVFISGVSTVEVDVSTGVYLYGLPFPIVTSMECLLYITSNTSPYGINAVIEDYSNAFYTSVANNNSALYFNGSSSSVTSLVTSQPFRLFGIYRTT